MVHLEFINFYQVLAVFKVLLLRVSTLRCDSERAPSPPFITENIQVRLNNSHPDLIAPDYNNNMVWRRKQPLPELEIT